MTQEKALAVLKTGKSVFLTGAPGAGKTYVLNQYVEYLKKKGVSVALTASTGIAATHIGGVTLHSWSGVLGRRELDNYEWDEILEKGYLKGRFLKTKVLVIDEISMIDGKFLDLVDQVMQKVSGKSRPFAGMQVVFVGDFFQLPPVKMKEEGLSYAFSSRVWKEVEPLMCYLSSQHRQSDGEFLSLLTSIREGDSERAMEILEECSEATYPEDMEPVRLYTHNVDVERINDDRLAELSGEVVSYSMKCSGKDYLVKRLVKSCLSPEVLRLKKGAMVMFTKNDFSAGYVNGTMGVVIDFSGEDEWPVIRVSDGRKIVVSREKWEHVVDQEVEAFIEQVPLRLAFAITVHKSQGMSIDCVEMDLSGCFEYGQGYVALSRASGRDGLSVKGINEMALLVDPYIQGFDRYCKNYSASVEKKMEMVGEEHIARKHRNWLIVCGIEVEDGEEIDDGEILLLLERKLSVMAMAREVSVKADRVVEAITRLLKDKKIEMEDILYLKDSSTLMDSDFKMILKIFKDLGEIEVGKMKEILGDGYTESEINLAKLFYTANDLVGEGGNYSLFDERI